MAKLFSGSGSPSVRIAVNVMRARLTVVGFNITVITFQLSLIPRIPGGTQLPGANVPLHLEADVALLVGLGLSIIAMVCFIASSAYDREGTCTHWSLLAGDLFMYSGLAHTVSGFFGPLVPIMDPVTLDTPQQTTELMIVHMAIVIVGGVAWFSAAYIGPALSLLRSPFGRGITAALGVGYLVLLVSLAHVSAQAVRLEIARDAKYSKPPPTLLNELVQPLRW